MCIKLPVQKLLIALLLILFIACEEELKPTVETPKSYIFLRNGQSSVSFTGQSIRIRMAEELLSGMLDFTQVNEILLLEKFRNQTANGADTNPFNSSALNKSNKSIKSKVAASKDYFSANTTSSAAIRDDFETWIVNQATIVASNKNTSAEAGKAGQIPDGNTSRYINELGLAYDQMLAKTLTGALMLDQALNNYLSSAVLDEGENRVNNNLETLEEGKTYTTMEHKWDEAYGYLYGTSANPEDPNQSIGMDDNFLNQAIGEVDKDKDYEGIADEILEAFKLGRAALVAREYEVRDEQASLIQTKISQILGIQAVHALQQGKKLLTQPNPERGAAFYALSQGFGFIYSLQFKRVANTDHPYFTKSEVDAFLTELMDDGENGLWDIKPATIELLSESIASRFDFSVMDAGSFD